MGKMRQFRRAIRNAVGKPLLFYAQDGYGLVLRGLFERVARGDRVHDADIHEIMADSRAEVEEIVGSSDDDREPKRVTIAAGPQQRVLGPDGKDIVVFSVRGIATYDLEYQPYCFSSALLAQNIMDAGNDPKIGTIVLDIDSPGGMVTGTAECGDAIFAARKRKKVIALVNPLAASAAYWLASQATEIIAIKSADVGSIGVFMVHTDCSKFNEMQGLKVTYIFAGQYKVEGNSDEPLSDDARAYYQSEVDAVYDQFTKAVARGRGVGVDVVLSTFGQGRCLMAANAKKVGMIDDFMAIGDALTHCGMPSAPAQDARRRNRAEGEADGPSTVSAADAAVVSAQSSTGAEAAALAAALVAERAARVAALTEGVESFAISVQQVGQAKFFYVDQPWPQKIGLTATLVEALQGNPFAAAGITDGQTKIQFVMANGAATYRKIGENAGGDWVCELEDGSTYQPKPAAPADTAGPEQLARAQADDELEAALAAAASERREAAIDAAFIRARALGA